MFYARFMQMLRPLSCIQLYLRLQQQGRAGDDGRYSRRFSGTLTDREITGVVVWRAGDLLCDVMGPVLGDGKWRLNSLALPFPLKVKKLKERTALHGKLMSELCDVTCHMRLHSVTCTRHKWTLPAVTPASKLVLDLSTPEGWKTELT